MKVDKEECSDFLECVFAFRYDKPTPVFYVIWGSNIYGFPS